MKIKDLRYKFRNVDGRTANVIRNSMMSAVMKVVSLVCSLIIVPMTIGYLSTENYGIWMAMTSILYWFSFCDVGLGNGMRNYMAEAIALGDYSKARSYFSTALVILSLIAVLMGCIVVPIVYICDLNDLFNTCNIDGIFLANVLTIAIIFSLMQFIVKNIGMVYVAMQKFAVNDLIVLLGSILSLFAVYILTKTTESNLLYIVTAFTGIPVLVFILASIPLFRQYPQLKPSRKSIDLEITKRIVSKGLGFFLIQITSCLVIFGSANIFISHYCGPQQVTIYNVAYKLFYMLVVGYIILISPLWNAYTEAGAKGDYQWIGKTFRNSLLLWLLSVLAGIILLFVSPWFFDLWIGDEVHVPFAVSACVMTYICIFNLNNCVTYLINGINKIRVQIITSIIGTILYLISISVIKGQYGIIGISLAMSITYILMALVHLYQCRLLIKNKAKGIWNK